VSIDNLSASLNNYVKKADYEQDIAEIKDALTWKDLA